MAGTARPFFLLCRLERPSLRDAAMTECEMPRAAIICRKERRQVAGIRDPYHLHQPHYVHFREWRRRPAASFVLDVTGYHRNVARDHGSPIVPDAEVHFALEHPNDLLVRMLMSSRMGAGFRFPPRDHPLLAGEDAALDFVGNTLPRQLRKRAEAEITGMTVPPFGCTGRLGKAP
jgi:hypothetical protein